MFRLRATATAQSQIRLWREVLLRGRGGSTSYRAVGYGLTMSPSAFAHVARTFLTAPGNSTASEVHPPDHGTGMRRSQAATPVSFRFTRSSVRANPANSLHGPGGGCLSSLLAQCRYVRVAGKEEPNEEKREGEAEEGTRENKTESEEGGEGNEEKTGGGKKRKQKQPPKKTLRDHINDLKNDFQKFPDIYNSANAINFIIFTVFCLCSTGSSSEEQWWLTQWGVDSTFRPLTWLLHSFLTNNFLSMTFAMMLLHTMCHSVLPAIGSQGLLIYVCATAIISGFIMFVGNRLYYGDKEAPEKQFGPWDIIAALYVLEYLLYGLTPIQILNSFNSWLRYACWVGQICILYFDWQPTLAGSFVGLALCKGHPRFRTMKAPGA